MDLYEMLGVSATELSKILQNKSIFVSISGLDNTGKSTQAKLLSRNYPELCSEPIHINQTEIFPKLSKNDLSRWWFDKNNAEIFVNTIYKALRQRYELGLKTGKSIVILDKGIEFYDTRVKATLLTKGLQDEEIFRLISNAKLNNGLVNNIEDLKIIITANSSEVDYIKEKNQDNDDVYLEYMSKNIKLLNEKLSNTKDFKEVKYITDNINIMHDCILKHIAAKILECTQLGVYKKIKESAIKSFEDNLNLVVLGGSAGKAKFIDGWSDLDLYLVLKHCDKNQILEFLNKIKSNVHIGTSFYSEDEIANNLIDNRSKMMFYELGHGFDQVLFKKEGYDCPRYKLDDILINDPYEKILAYGNLKRLLYYKNINNINRTFENVDSGSSGKIIKGSILLEKILLRDSPKKVIGSSYIDTNLKYYEYLKSERETNNNLDENQVRLIGSTDLVDYIKNIKNKNKEIYDYGEAVLGTAETILI